MIAHSLRETQVALVILALMELMVHQANKEHLVLGG